MSLQIVPTPSVWPINIILFWYLYTPRFNEVERGVYWYHLVLLSVCLSVRLSICGQNCVRFVSSTILMGSISYLHILSSNLRRCVACKACFKITNLKFWRIFYICNFDLVFLWLGIQYDSMVWVSMRRRGVSSDRRRSSCSSCLLNSKLIIVHMVIHEMHVSHIYQCVSAILQYLHCLCTRYGIGLHQSIDKWK